MKVLFLDIDGVLNGNYTSNKPDELYRPYISDLDQECMNNLQLILDAHPDLRIIIHSAWRTELSPFQFRKIFNEVGFPIISDRLFGITNPEVNKPESIYEMIQMLRLENFVIIEDEQLFDFEDELYGRLHKTSGFRGMTTEDAMEVSKMFV